MAQRSITERKSRNYQITSYVVSTPRSSWLLRFNSSDIHHPVSTQDSEFITMLNRRWNVYRQILTGVRLQAHADSMKLAETTMIKII